MCLYRSSLVQPSPNLSREEQQVLKGGQSHNVQLVLKIVVAFIPMRHIQNVERMLSKDVDNFECEYINTCLRKVPHREKRILENTMTNIKCVCTDVP